MSKTTYSEKLKNPKWQRRRLEILQRDGFKCTCCQDEETTLHVHHLDYLPGFEPWDHPDHLLITLCETCHYKIGQSIAFMEDNLKTWLKMKLQNAFLMDCMSSVCNHFDRLDSFFYMAKELGEEKALAALRVEYDKIKQGVPDENCPVYRECEACLQQMKLYKNFNTYKCGWCGHEVKNGEKK